MTMPCHLNEVCCASIPLANLRYLTPLRLHPEARGQILGERFWLSWESGDETVLRIVLPIRGAELFVRRNGEWYRPGARLPSSGIPEEMDHSLATYLIPALGEALPSENPACPRLFLSLVREEHPRPTTALRCRAVDLLPWADFATTNQLNRLRAIRWRDQLLLVGEGLPIVPPGERYWGQNLLVPLGFRPEPGLPESVLIEALKLDAGQMALWSNEGIEVIPAGLWRPLTRRAVRLMVLA